MSYTTVDTLWGHILVYVLKLLILFCENAELNDFNSFVHTRKAVKDKAVPHKEIYHNAIQKKKKTILNELCISIPEELNLGYVQMPHWWAS